MTMTVSNGNGDNVKIPRWMWGVLLVAVAWGVRVEVQLASLRGTERVVYQNAGKVERIDREQAQRTHSFDTMRALTEEVRQLRRDVIELMVELRHLKRQFAEPVEPEK